MGAKPFLATEQDADRDMGYESMLTEDLSLLEWNTFTGR